VRLGRLLVVAALTIAITSFAVWQVWPWNSDALANLRLGEWPQGAVLFALGVHAGETGWLEDLPARLRRRLGRVALIGAAVTVVLFAVLDARGRRRPCSMRPPVGRRCSSHSSTVW
jgi:glucans biosynthesis protein C